MEKLHSTFKYVTNILILLEMPLSEKAETKND